MRSSPIIAAVALALGLAGCGGGQRQDAHEPSGKFKVAISSSSFPASQTLSEHTHLTIAVRNTGTKTIPDIAVTICNVTCDYRAPQGEGTSARPFAADSSQVGLANPSRPTWVIDRPPGACHYSCQNGGAGAAVTAYANTWALGALKPGRTVRFQWAVTAVSAGHHVVAWQLAAGLNGKARAVLADGSAPRGSFPVTISAKPQQSYVNNNGQIVVGSGN